MGILASVTGVTAASAAGAVVLAQTTVPAETIPSVWTIAERAGPWFSAALLILLFEVVRRHDKKDTLIAAKDATILELSQRVVKIGEDSNAIGRNSMEIAQKTERLLGELVAVQAAIVKKRP